MKKFQVFGFILCMVGIALWQIDAFAVKTTVLTFLSMNPDTVGAGLVMAMAGVAAPFPTDQKYISVAVAYKNGKLIADEASPRTPTATKEFKVKKFALADGITIPDTSVGRLGRPNVVNFGFTEDPAFCVDYALDGLVPQSDIDNAPAGYDPEAHQTESITDLLMLDREKRVADQIFNVNNYAAANKLALAGNQQWSDFVNSDPLGNILTALDSVVMRPNVIIFGQAVWTKFRQHPKIVKATHGNAGDSGIAARQAVAELLELDKVLIGEGFYNSAKKGQVVVRTRLWGNFVSLICLDPLATINGDRITFSVTAQYKNIQAGSIPDPDIG
ncbi:MAG TPA: hypothetical protein VHO70_12925, partial [Chitinispirillaceae bacterium]|nr:hypothetical protein [Chitinispirillaceae bacterium]